MVICAASVLFSLFMFCTCFQQVFFFFFLMFVSGALQLYLYTTVFMEAVLDYNFVFRIF